MKIRNAFVSNSSSTSYILAYKCEPCKECGVTFDIASLCDKSNDCDTECDYYNKSLIDYYQELVDKTTQVLEALKNRNKDDVMNRWYTVGEYADELNNDLSCYKNILQKIKSYYKQGYHVCRADISYHDNILNNILDVGIKSGKIIIIEQEN